MHQRLERNFFSQDTITVAQQLLGKKLIFNDYQGIIIETEAYIGQDDPACHAARGITPRTKVMFGPPGFTYVYFIYGMYHCLNFVTEPEGKAAAVLIRGLKIEQPDPLILNGPGKLCRHLNIDRTHNNIDLITSPVFYIQPTNINSIPFKTTPRIGISKGQDKLWRFEIEACFLKEIKSQIVEIL